MRWLKIKTGSPIFLAILLNMQAQADESTRAADTIEFTIIDSFVEIHTGPGRGYPIFHVVEEGETVEILTRRPDWYEVKSKNGNVGWARASALARTLEPTGDPVDLPSVSYGDYLKNSWRVGFTMGQYVKGELDGSDNFSVTGGYRPLSWLGVEVEWGKTYSAEVSGDYYGANLLLEPLSRWRVSPYVLVGIGRMSVDAQPKLVPLGIDESSYNAFGFGGSFYLVRNFVLRGEYRWYEVSADPNDVDLQEWKIGFSAFF